MKILNAFSLQMIWAQAVADGVLKVEVYPLSAEEAAGEMASRNIESCIGHASTAAIVSELLGVEVPVNRCDVRLARGESALVAQYLGPRLPEGATSLPEGATIGFAIVHVAAR